MHILLIITDYGSFNNFLSELALKLVQTGNQVDVICSPNKVIKFDDRINYAEFGIKMHFLEFPRGFHFSKQMKASVAINRLVDKISPDLVHIHFTTGIFTTLFYKRPKMTTIGTIHGLGSPMMKGTQKAIFRIIENFCFFKLDQIWVLNNFDHRILMQRHSKKTFMLNSAGVGCDLQRFDINVFEGKDEEIKKELGIKATDFVITFTGRFVHFKGFHLVVKSFIQLNKLYPSTFKLVLIGGNDPIHVTGLTKEEESEYLDCDSIINVGFTSNVEKYLSISDTFLFPSLKEGMPVCIMEALAMGVPVITANSRGCNDLVIPEINGILLSDLPDIEEVISAIIRLKQSPSFCQSLRDYNLAHRDSLSRDIYIDQQIRSYKKTLNVCQL